MNIPISILVCLFLTMLTGTVALGFYTLVLVIDRKKQALKAHYWLLKLVLLLFIIPVCFCIELLYRYEDGMWINTIFAGSLLMNRVANVLLVAWIVGMGIGFIKVCKQIIKHRLYIKTYQKTDRYNDVLDEVKKSLGVKQKIYILEGEYNISPFVSGVFIPTICVPKADYNRETMTYIIKHELTHYKHRDVLWLCILRVLFVVYWFYSVFWREKLINLYRELMEDVCDIDVCKQNNEYDDYIRILISTALKTEELTNPAPVFLSENCKDIIRRKNNMKRYQQQKPMKRLMITMLVVALFCSSTGVVYAAEQAVVTGYRSVYDATSIGWEEEMNGNMENTLIEYREPAVDDPNITVEYVDNDMATYSNVYPIDVTLSGNSERRYTTGHTLNAGDKILVAVNIDPADKNVKVGFRMSTGEIRYIVGAGDIYHTFTIYDDATYYFFVQNSNSTTVEVGGYYDIR